MGDRDWDALAVKEPDNDGDPVKPLAVKVLEEVGERVCVGLVENVAESDGERESVRDVVKLLEKHALGL